MNIYELSNKELHKLHNEFNKTSFGRRAKLFSILPFILSVFSLLLAAGDVIANGEAELFVCFILNFAFLCVTQLQYGNMLRDYALSKKDIK